MRKTGRRCELSPPRQQAISNGANSLPLPQESARGKGVIPLVAHPPAQAVQCRGRTADKTKLAGFSNRVLRADGLGTMQDELIENQRVTQLKLRDRRRSERPDERIVPMPILAGEHGDTAHGGMRPGHDFERRQVGADRIERHPDIDGRSGYAKDRGAVGIGVPLHPVSHAAVAAEVGALGKISPLGPQYALDPDSTRRSDCS